MNPEQFQSLFRDWVKAIQGDMEPEVIAIDGKSSRHSFDNDKNMLHMISAYATDARLVLAQAKVTEKSNEITAIPKLLDWLDLEGRIVTIDAMGCQHEIADKILNQQGNYIFSLKGNQGNLNEDVRTYMTDASFISALKSEVQNDKGHGRLETRTCWVSTDISWLHDRHDQWKSIKSIIRIDSIREAKGKATAETRYYISSCQLTPQKTLAAIRSHWAIENNLHWVLDMSFGEDRSRMRKNNAPQIMAVIRQWRLTFCRLQQIK